jgi:putative ABC transport system substrate-binding protein
MRRRDFIVGLGGASAWPVARARSAELVRRLGFLTGSARVEQLAELAAFRDALAKLGWVEGRNVQLDVRFGGSELDRSIYAAELVKLGADAIVAVGGGAVQVLREKTQTIPIVSIGSGDAFGYLVSNIARPEGNVTGVSNLFDTIGSKWLELLKDAVPQIQNVAFIDSAIKPTAFFPSLVEAAGVLGVQAVRIPFGDVVDFVHRVDGFAAGPNAGLIIAPIIFAPYPEIILALAVQHRLPTVVGISPRKGALICYGPDYIELYTRAASLVDHIFRGAKVSELLFEYPTRFQLVVNLKTAREIGVTISESFLVRADEVIE